MTKIGDLSGMRPDLGPSGSSQPDQTTTALAGETTLAQVAQRLGVSEDTLRAANPQINPSRLSPGAEIRTARGFSLASVLGGGQGQTGAAPQPGVQGRSPEAQLEAMMLKQQVKSSIAGEGGKGSSGIDLQSFASKGELTSVASMGPGFDAKTGLTMITNDQWTMEMLTGELTQETLSKMKDPAAFLNARKEVLSRPTNAVYRNPYDGKETPMNPTDMATPAQAESIRERLISLGMSASFQPELPKLSEVDYKGDDRRHFTIGGLNVGRLMERYAMYPKETADEMTRAELSQRGPAAS
ncbi:MAG: LysM peptidoglycan-binding domain-containing protein [Acidobacteria bacterium]|nr:LysM peptidoglycan-binding domain-containing protein [Acidobacteriota bacterium]